jgi:hypothetical protein
MRKTFNLETKLGRMTFIVNGADQIYLETPREKSPAGEIITPIVIRGKEHTGTIHFTKVNDHWEGLGYGNDGNTLVPVGLPGVDNWLTSRSMYLQPAHCFSSNSATHVAKAKFYEEIYIALNAFWSIPEGRVAILSEMKDRAAERHSAEIEICQAQIEKLRDELTEAHKEMAKLTA